MEANTKKLVEELLDEGYDSRFISSELGISIKKIKQIKSQRYLPELNHDESTEAKEKEILSQKSHKTNNNNKIGQNQIPVEHQQTLKTTKTSKSHWRSINEQELTGPELNTTQVCDEILTRLKSKGETVETLESIKKNLSQAQYKASRARKNEGLALPLRLARDSSLLFHHYAIKTIGSAGRSNSSKYQRIIDSNNVP